jgi:hypothetical protein
MHLSTVRDIRFPVPPAFTSAAVRIPFRHPFRPAAEGRPVLGCDWSRGCGTCRVPDVMTPSDGRDVAWLSEDFLPFLPLCLSAVLLWHRQLRCRQQYPAVSFRLPWTERSPRSSRSGRTLDFRSAGAQSVRSAGGWLSSPDGTCGRRPGTRACTVLPGAAGGVLWPECVSVTSAGALTAANPG